MSGECRAEFKYERALGSVGTTLGFRWLSSLVFDATKPGSNPGLRNNPQPLGSQCRSQARADEAGCDIKGI